MENQLVKEDKVRTMLDGLYAMLTRKSAELAPLMREINMDTNTKLPRRLDGLERADRQPEKTLRQMLLTPRQVKHCEEIQKLCSQIHKLQEQINMLVVTAELDLPVMQLFELPDYLMKMDSLFADSKVAAARLGVKTDIAPNVKHAPVNSNSYQGVSREHVRH